MTELLDTPETSQDEQLIEDTTRRVVGRLYEIGPRGYSLDHGRSENPSLTDEQIIDQRVKQKLYPTYDGNTERKVPKDLELLLLQDLLNGIETNPDKVSTKDFALLHDVFETIAKTTDFLQSKEPAEMRFANLLINRYIAATREFILADPSGGDLLAADTEDSRNAFRIYIATESAVAGDFETARGMLVDVDGYEEAPLETALLVRLEEAELESRITNQKITPETSAANMQHLGLSASQEAIHRVEQADPHITIGTSLETLEEMLSPGGRYMTLHEIHIISAGNIRSSNKVRRGKTNPEANQLRVKAEMALGHSTNPFFPKIIYGALTSDLQEDRGSGYGPVTLHLKSEVTDDPSTTFTYGDSLAATNGEVTKLARIQLTGADARIAHAHNIEARERPNKYVEAHVAGVDFDKIDKVSIVSSSNSMGELKPVVAAAESCLERDVKTEVIINVRGWGISQRIQERIASGMTEDEAIELTVRRLRSNFNQYHDSPLLSLVFVFKEDSELPEDHPSFAGKINRELFARHGVIIREAEVDGRF